MTDAIRATLTSKGLKEATDRPDVTVEFTASGQDYSVGPFGRASPIEPNRGGRPGRGRGGAADPQSIQPVACTEGLLVLDLLARESGLLIWRGVYRDSEKNTGKFAQRLPDDAKTLLAQYPPRKR